MPRGGCSAARRGDNHTDKFQTCCWTSQQLAAAEDANSISRGMNLFLCGCVAVQPADLQVFNMLSYFGWGPFHLCCPQALISLIKPTSHSSQLSALIYESDPFTSKFTCSPRHSALLSGADEVRFDHLSALPLLAINFMRCHFSHLFFGAETLPWPESQRQNWRGERNQLPPLPLPLKQAVSKSIGERGTKGGQRRPVAPQTSKPQEDRAGSILS